MSVKIGGKKNGKAYNFMETERRIFRGEKQQIKAEIKEGLEGLAGQIPGLTDIKVRIDCLSSSNVDVMLDSTFVDEEALHNYSTNPQHVAVADTKVRPYTAIRSCMDFEI